MHKPLVSVIMSVYSEPIEWIQKAMESVFRQGMSDYEYIVIHDNPQDVETWNFLNEMSRTSSKVVLLRNNVNIGLTKSLNIALKHAHGKYIARIDADDIWHENKMYVQCEYMKKHPDVDVCGTNVNFIDDDGRFLQVMDFPHSHEAIGIAMAETNPIVHSSVLFKTDVIRRRAPFYYNEDYRSSQDYELWSSLYLQGVCFVNLRNHLVDYRLSSNQITKKRRTEQLKNAENIKSNYINVICARNRLPNLWGRSLQEIISNIVDMSASLDCEILYQYLYLRLLKDKSSKWKKIVYIISGRLYLHLSLRKIIKIILL